VESEAGTVDPSPRAEDAATDARRPGYLGTVVEILTLGRCNDQTLTKLEAAAGCKARWNEAMGVWPAGAGPRRSNL
jgi:hypothetical protein